MLEKRDVRFLPGARREAVWARAWEWWSRQGFQLSQTGPYRCRGTSVYARIGLKRELDLAIDEASGGCSADLTFRARITDEGLIAGAVTAVVLWPVALVGGAVSYSEYESDARNLLLAFWQFVSPAPDAPAATQPPEMPLPCKACGSALLPDWKVCPYCGRSRDA